MNFAMRQAVMQARRIPAADDKRTAVRRLLDTIKAALHASAPSHAQ